MGRTPSSYYFVLLLPLFCFNHAAASPSAIPEPQGLNAGWHCDAVLISTNGGPARAVPLIHLGTPAAAKEITSVTNARYVVIRIRLYRFAATQPSDTIAIKVKGFLEYTNAQLYNSTDPSIGWKDISATTEFSRDPCPAPEEGWCNKVFYTDVTLQVRTPGWIDISFVADQSKAYKAYGFEVLSMQELDGPNPLNRNWNAVDFGVLDDGVSPRLLPIAHMNNKTITAEFPANRVFPFLWMRIAVIGARAPDGEPVTVLVNATAVRQISPGSWQDPSNVDATVANVGGCSCTSREYCAGVHEVEFIILFDVGAGPVTLGFDTSFDEGQSKEFIMVEIREQKQLKAPVGGTGGVVFAITANGTTVTRRALRAETNTITHSLDGTAAGNATINAISVGDIGGSCSAEVDGVREQVFNLPQEGLTETWTQITNMTAVLGATPCMEDACRVLYGRDIPIWLRGNGTLTLHCTMTEGPTGGGVGLAVTFPPPPPVEQPKPAPQPVPQPKQQPVPQPVPQPEPQPEPQPVPALQPQPVQVPTTQGPAHVKTSAPKPVDRPAEIGIGVGAGGGLAIIVGVALYCWRRRRARKRRSPDAATPAADVESPDQPVCASTPAPFAKCCDPPAAPQQKIAG